MKIALIGYFGHRNVGDDLLLRAVYNNIKEINPEAIITVYGKNETNISNMVDNSVIIKSKNPIKILIDLLFNQDALIIGPGGLFPSKKTAKILFYLATLTIMKLKRGIGLGIGVGIGTGNFKSKLDIYLLNKMFKASKAFVIRQEAPVIPAITECVQNNKLIVATDVMLSKNVLKEVNAEKDSKKVVVSLANIFADDEAMYKKEFINRISEVIAEVINSGYYVKLIPFSNERDESLNDEVAKVVNNKDCISVPYVEEPNDAVREIYSARFTICMRFHAVILSLRENIPCCAIAYSDKSEDIMDRVGLKDYCVRFGINDKEYFNEKVQIDSVKMTEIFKNMVINEINLSETIKLKKEKLVDMSEINFDYMKNFLD